MNRRRLNFDLIRAIMHSSELDYDQSMDIARRYSQGLIQQIIRREMSLQNIREQKIREQNESKERSQRSI